MIRGGLARRYAKALYHLAAESGREEEVTQELGRFAAAYAGSELASVLNNPAFGLADRKAVVARTAAGLGVSSLPLHFLSLLLERRRLAFLAVILVHYRRLLNDAKGRVDARVVTARALDDGEREGFRAALREITGKEVLLEAQEDPELIGGAVVYLEGMIYDGSVQTLIAKMRERIEQGI
jgi:F-type H+-transporting ATPase subunit delta